MNKHIIKNPRITEKATLKAGENVYTFDVIDSANKTEIKKAIFTLYKVHPTKVSVLYKHKKKAMLRGKAGERGGGKKAMIYLKDGDKIEFI